MSVNTLKHYAEKIIDFITDKKYRKLVIAVVISGAVIYKVIEGIPTRKIRRACKKIREQKESKHIQLIEISQEKKTQILALKAFELAEAIQLNKFTPEEVLYTYIERAETLGRKFNLTAEEPFEDALSRLSSLPPGPLSGVPISVKDQFFQENCHSSAGIYWKACIPDSEDSILISLLRKAGAVPFARGNVMQLLMWYEAVNNIYGRAENPWDPKRTPGGSSGGDAGLIAAGAAPLAIGGDLAGSIRIPAAFCGVYGFKPSSCRIMSGGCAEIHPDRFPLIGLLVKPSYGPISRCVEDLVLVMQTWWKKELWENDNLVVPLTFNNQEYSDNRKLRIGFFDYNEVFECAGVVKNAIRETCEKLAEDGHVLVEMKMDIFPRATEAFLKALFAMDGKFLLEQLQGEDSTWAYMSDYISAKYHIPKFMMLSYLKFCGFKKLAYYLSLTKPLSHKEFCNLAGEFYNIKVEFNKYWQSLNLDVAICPIWPLVAPYHETTKKLIQAFSYAFFWNIVDFPAGIVPVKLVEQGENKYEFFEDDSYIKVAQQNMENSVGMPVCIQIVGNVYQDEKVLRVMKIVQDYYNFHKTSL